MNIGGAKHNYGPNSIFEGGVKFDNISIGLVTSIADENDGNRIKIRIKGIDDALSDKDLPHAFPLLPKFINILPVVGESVFVFSISTENKQSNRLWLGPIISQPQKLKFDSHFYSSTSLLPGAVGSPEKAPSTIPDAKGVYPKKNEIALQGRDNTDIIFKPNQITIRAGKFEIGDNLKFNEKNIGYFQIKHDVVIDKDNNTRGTVSNIVANKINLLSHDGITRFVINGNDELISDAELEKILIKAQRMVYGDLLVELITLIKEFIVNHTHPYSGLPPVQDITVKKILKFDLNKLLSNNIRLN